MVTSNEARCARPNRCRHVPTALQIPNTATPPVAAVKPTKGRPHRAIHGQYMRPAAPATAMKTFSHDRHVPPAAGDVARAGDAVAPLTFPTATLPAALATAGTAFRSASNCSSETEASCLSILAISASQLRSLIEPCVKSRARFPWSSHNVRSSCRDSIAACREPGRSRTHSSRTPVASQPERRARPLA